MSIEWRGGKDLRRLGQNIEKWGDSVKAEAIGNIGGALEEGAAALVAGLEAATTTTGERRVAGGGESAGRHDTGRMVRAVGTNAGSLDWQAAMTWGQFGWDSTVYQEYFKEQDLGLPGNYEAANAMQPAFIRARESFRARMGQSFRRK